MEWDAEVDVIIAGGGGGGLITALTVAQSGLEVAVFEKTEHLLGNTAASASMIPACNTKFQHQLGIDDSVEKMTADILMKNHNESDPALVRALATVSGEMVEWINDSLQIEMSVVLEFKYPGHSALRMHAPPSRSGLELMKKLKRKVSERDNIYLLLQTSLQKLIQDDTGHVIGIEVSASEGTRYIKGRKVVIATNGFGGNKELVKQHIPEIAVAAYFGYEANTGEGMEAGITAGAATKSLTAYQGHAGINENTGLLVTWGTIMMGGFYINSLGERFANETQGYSEFTREVLKQPEQYGYIIYDERIHRNLLSIEDYKQITEMEAYKTAETVEVLAQKIQVDVERLSITFKNYQQQQNGQADAFGREFFDKSLENPLYAIEVIPALFHTQGGLLINPHAQVLDTNANIIPNVYAIGGSAVGISGNHAYGYMSGNGLLAALGFGRIAGLHIVESLAEEKGGVIL
ncbi:fumarate reductase flavoprotein subunit [Lysinibacillus sp. RC46]|uniref:FAD-dependent oxidoreductase n=1 Tax=unclassified Lysinibacillus TaxID=2636778 RepID=UPI0035164CCC